MNAPEQARLRMTVPMEVGICCADLDGMLAFYTGVLGLALVNRVSVPADKAAATGLTSAGYDVARLQTSYGERVKLLQPAVAPQPRPAAGAILDRQGATYLTFIVRDLPGVVRQLQARGVTFDSAPAPMEVRPGTWLAFFRDPEGNVLELVEYDDPPPTDPTSSPTRPPPLNRTSTWHTSSSFPPWPPTPRAAICTSGSSRKATRSPSATRWPKSRPKAIVEINAEHAGVLGRIVVAAGASSVPVNTVLGVLLADGEDASAIERALAEQGVAPAAAPAAPAPAAATPPLRAAPPPRPARPPRPPRPRKPSRPRAAAAACPARWRVAWPRNGAWTWRASRAAARMAASCAATWKRRATPRPPPASRKPPRRAPPAAACRTAACAAPSPAA